MWTDNKNIEDVDKLLLLLPTKILTWLNKEFPDKNNIVEIILDLGRQPQVRFINNQSYDFVNYTEYTVTEKDINSILTKKGMSKIHENNRAGLDGTLHRISVIRDLSDNVVGLTLRVGRIIPGTADIIYDLIASGKSILIVGRPGKGKTSKLREACFILSKELRKRVIIVDTSNEIAGEAVIPHLSVGDSRRMMVPKKDQQVRVMVEAVENHMPEVVVVDEISLQQEANAAKTIAERGVQLLATAHGDTLENILSNPPLSILVGGSKSVTLGDKEASKRGTAKTIRERENIPVFDVVVELIDFDTVAIHNNVADAVDGILRGDKVKPELRRLIPELADKEIPYIVLQQAEISRKHIYQEPVVSEEFENFSGKRLDFSGSKVVHSGRRRRR